MSIIRWEDPPRANTSWVAVIAELREHPGRWARVFEPSQNLRRAQNARTSCVKHGAEAVVRKVNGEGHGVWARWPVENPRSTTNLPRAHGSVDA